MNLEFVLALAAFLLFFQFGMRYVLIYRFTDSRVEVLLFGILPVSSTRYDLIIEVKIISPWMASLWPAVWMQNRLIGEFVRIRRSGLPVLITPDDPEEFVRELQRRVYEQTGEWLLRS